MAVNLLKAGIIKEEDITPSPIKPEAPMVAALDMIRGFEQFRPSTYLPTKDDVPTIGYGHTRGVKPNQTITKEKAEELLTAETDEISKQIDKLVNVDLNENQRAAITSLIYNVGITAFRKSDALKALNEGDYDKFRKLAFDEEKGWTRQKGKKLKGLVKRRKVEEQMFLNDETSAAPRTLTEEEQARLEAIKTDLPKKVLTNDEQVRLRDVIASLQEPKAPEIRRRPKIRRRPGRRKPKGAVNLAASGMLKARSDFTQPEEKEFKNAWDFLADPLIGTADFGAALGSAALAFPFQKLGGLASMRIGGNVSPEEQVKHAKEMEEFIGQLFYQPKTEMGQGAMDVVGKAFETFLTPTTMASKQLSKTHPRLGYLLQLTGELAQLGAAHVTVKNLMAGKRATKLDLEKIREELKDHEAKEAILKAVEEANAEELAKAKAARPDRPKAAPVDQLPPEIIEKHKILREAAKEVEAERVVKARAEAERAKAARPKQPEMAPIHSKSGPVNLVKEGIIKEPEVITVEGERLISQGGKWYDAKGGEVSYSQIKEMMKKEGAVKAEPNYRSAPVRGSSVPPKVEAKPEVKPEPKAKLTFAKGDTVTWTKGGKTLTGTTLGAGGKVRIRVKGKDGKTYIPKLEEVTKAEAKVIEFPKKEDGKKLLRSKNESSKLKPEEYSQSGLVAALMQEEAKKLKKKPKKKKLTPNDQIRKIANEVKGNTYSGLGDLTEVEAKLLKLYQDTAPKQFKDKAEFHGFLDAAEKLLGEVRKRKNKAVDENPYSDFYDIEYETSKPPKETVESKKPDAPPKEVDKSFLTKPDGNPFNKPGIAEMIMKRKGIKGKVVKNPIGDGYVIKASELNDPGVFADLKTLFGDERGSFSFEKMSPEKQAALERLCNKAARQGRRMLDALLELKIPVNEAKKIAEHFGEGKEQIKNNPAQLLYEANPNEIIKQRKRVRKGEVIHYPPVTKLDLRNLKDLPELLVKPLGGAFERAISTFEQLGPWAKEFYYQWREAENKISQEMKVERKFIRGLTKKLSRKERIDLGIAWIASQTGGKAIIKNMGKKIPKLNARQLGVKAELEPRFEEFLHRINEMRVQIGQNPMNEVTDYLSFFRENNILHDLGIKTNLVSMKEYTIRNAKPQSKSTGFRHAKSRTGLDKPVMLDPLEIYSGYVGRGIRHIHVSPIVAKIAELRRPIRDPKTGRYGTLKNYKPKSDEFLRKWSNRIAGLDEFPVHRVVDKGVRKISENLAFSILGGNVHTYLAQFAVMRNLVTEVDLVNIAGGISDTIIRSDIHKLSEHLPSRSMDISLTDAVDAIRFGRLGKVKQVVGKATLKPMSIVDGVMAEISFHAGYRQAKKLGLEGKNAARYADDLTVRTNASGLKGDIAPIQANALGKALTLFQTFVINDWNFLMRDVLGVRNPNIVNSQRVWKAFKFVIGTYLLNQLYEEAFDTSSPFPTPFRTFYEKQAEGKSQGDTALAVTKEFLEPIPILGGMRYGSTILGPVAEIVADVSKIMTDNPYKKSLSEVLAKVGGIPGTAQIGKMIRAQKRGEDFWGQLVGSYHPKKSRSRSRRRRRRSRRTRSRR